MRQIFCLLLVIFPTIAAAWTEPARGTADRRALMDAVRPHAERIFGAPVQFVVGTLRVDGDVGFATLSAQRPGGVPIDVRKTPGWQDGYFMSDADHLSGQVLYVRSGATWVAQHFVFGATDVWWADPRLCPRFKPVIPEVCP